MVSVNTKIAAVDTARPMLWMRSRKFPLRKAWRLKAARMRKYGRYSLRAENSCFSAIVMSSRYLYRHVGVGLKLEGNSNNYGRRVQVFQIQQNFTSICTKIPWAELFMSSDDNKSDQLSPQCVINARFMTAFRLPCVAFASIGLLLCFPHASLTPFVHLIARVFLWHFKCSQFFVFKIPFNIHIVEILFIPTATYFHFFALRQWEEQHFR